MAKEKGSDEEDFFSGNCFWNFLDPFGEILLFSLQIRLVTEIQYGPVKFFLIKKAFKLNFRHRMYQETNWSVDPTI